jgi:hypothetical protein
VVIGVTPLRFNARQGRRQRHRLFSINGLTALMGKWSVREVLTGFDLFVGEDRKIRVIVRPGRYHENLDLLGSEPIDGTGNDLANVINGNSGNNRLSGGDGNDTLLGNAGQDVLGGGRGNDFLSGGARTDVLSGGVGADRLIGGEGLDVLTGGDNADSFIFEKISDTADNALVADVITDFGRGQDKIDLSAIDASSVLPGNNAFTFDGKTPFGTSKNGDIYFKTFDNPGTANDYTMIYIDTDSDAASEGMIWVAGLHSFTASDFIL